MSRTTGRALLSAILAFVLAATCYCVRAADDNIPDMIRVLENPAAPEQRPEKPEKGISAAEWEANRHEAWARFRLEVQKALSARGAAAVPHLLDLIKRTNDNSVKILALTALTQMKNPEALRPAIPAAMTLLDDPNVGIAYLAAKLLGNVRHPDAVEPLTRLVKHEQAVLRTIAADSLGKIGDTRASTPLLGLLEDKEKDVRLHATEAIAALGVAFDTIPKLAERLDSEDINERNAAQEAINKLIAYDLPRDSDWLSARRDTRKKAIDRFGQWWADSLKNPTIPITDELSLRLNHCRNAKLPIETRRKAVDMIRRLGNRKTVDILIGIMLDRDSRDIRKDVAAAASALSGIELKCLGSESDPEWTGKVDQFRRRLEK